MKSAAPSADVPQLSETNIQERRRTVKATEYAEIDVSLEDLFIAGKLSIYPQIANGDFLRANASSDRIKFQAGGYMGLIPLNDRIVLDIRPRVPARNLERMLLIAEHSAKSLQFFNRPYLNDDQVIPSLIEILAAALIDSLAVIQQQGLHREYVRKETDTPFPKGKISLGQTLQKHILRGRNHLVRASWFEQTTDTPVNRCLKYTIWFLAQKFRLMTPRKGWRTNILKLNQLYHLFGKVKLDLSRAFLKDKFVGDPSLLPSIRSYYDTPLRIAKTIIRDHGVSLDRPGDDVLLPSLVFRMEDVFEKYALEVLRMRGEQYRPHLEVLDGEIMPPHGGAKLLFDAAPSEKATPDIVFKFNAVGSAVFPLIIDAKYKDNDKPLRADLNQVISYGCSYRSPVVLLLSPVGKKKTAGLSRLGTIDRMQIYEYKIDLASQTPDLEDDKFFDTIMSLIPEMKEPADL